jgi:two-component SAPR family response regulator
MKAICVDDEELILYMIVKMCESLPQLDEVKGFKSATQALDWMKER